MANLTGFLRDNKGAYIIKDPDANIVYGVDWTDYLNAGDNLSSADVTIETISGDSSPLAFPTNEGTDVSLAGGSLVNIRLRNGSEDNEYNIDVKVVTANGDTDSRRFRIIVKRKHL